MKKGLVVEREAQLIGVFLFDSGQKVRGIPLGKVRAKTKIYAGDYVRGRLNPDGTFAIEEVEERKNLLIRPPIANVDRVICVCSIRDPDFDNYLLDCLLAVYDHVGCDPVIVFNKIDALDEEGEKELKLWTDLYRDAGYEVIHVSAKSQEGLERLKDVVEGEICILAGPSGVGKSSILKALTGAELRTGEVSHKTGRGRHTTTGVKLLPFGKGSFMGDSPGFSKVEPLNFIRRKEIRNYFREFLRYECKFPDCTHTTEPGCEVKEALRRGEISCHRFKSYLKMMKVFLEELKEICP